MSRRTGLKGLALSPDGQRVAVGRFNGSLAVYETASGKPVVSTPPPAQAGAPAKPQLVRNASLNPPSPAKRGARTSREAGPHGQRRGDGHYDHLPRAGFDRDLGPRAKPDPNRLEVDLVVTPEGAGGDTPLWADHTAGRPPVSSLDHFGTLLTSTNLAPRKNHAAPSRSRFRRL